MLTVKEGFVPSCVIYVLWVGPDVIVNAVDLLYSNEFVPAPIVLLVIVAASKIGLPENRLRVSEYKSSMERFQSNILLSFALSSHMISLTNETTVLL